MVPDRFGPRYGPRLERAELRVHFSKSVRLCSGTRAVRCPIHGMVVYSSHSLWGPWSGNALTAI